MLILVLDVETTGLTPADHVIELGSCDLMDGTVGKPMEDYVTCPVPIPPELSAVHHIIDADLRTGFPLEETWRRHVPGGDGRHFNAFAAHNAKFERQWLEAFSGSTPWICTYRCALRVWPDAPKHNNGTLRYWLKPEGLMRHIAEPPHRAGPDAYVTAFLLRELLKLAPIDKLIEWSNQPALLPRLQFGKHKGMKFSEAPRDYLQWLSRQPDMDENVKFTAACYLNGGTNA